MIGKFIIFIRFSILSYFDLKFIRVGEVVGSDVELIGSDLFYSRLLRVLYRFEFYCMGEGLVVEFGFGIGDGNVMFSVFIVFISVGFFIEMVYSES